MVSGNPVLQVPCYAERFRAWSRPRGLLAATVETAMAKESPSIPTACICVWGFPLTDDPVFPGVYYRDSPDSPKHNSNSIIIIIIIAITITIKITIIIIIIIVAIIIILMIIIIFAKQ